MHNVERKSWTVLDTELHIIPSTFNRKEDGKETEKDTAREPRKVESSKVEKVETMGKEKVNKRRDNVQVDLGNNGLNNLGAQKSTLPVGVTMIGAPETRQESQWPSRAEKSTVDDP